MTFPIVGDNYENPGEGQITMFEVLRTSRNVLLSMLTDINSWSKCVGRVEALLVVALNKSLDQGWENVLVQVWEGLLTF